MTTPSIGPILAATIVSRDFRASIAAWCDYLGQHVHSEMTVSKQIAKHWGYSDLAGRRVTWLANALNEPWLRIVESPNADICDPFEFYGWFALQINVQDIDQLFEDLEGSPFKVIRDPVTLSVNQAIRAMQIVGPDNEVIYLLEINGEFPPFEVPPTRCYVDRVFNSVVTVPNRDHSIAVFETFENTNAMLFETKVEVFSRAKSWNPDTLLPVATVQLAGRNLVEIDQIAGLQGSTLNNRTPASGIGVVTFEVDSLPEGASSYTTKFGPTIGRLATVRLGTTGELIELVERAPS